MAAELQKIDLSVVVLAYKNGPILESWIGQLHRSLSTLTASWEIILVTNVYPGEIDEAQNVAKKLEKNLPHVRRVALTKAGGYGWDVKSGLAVAHGKTLAYVDGDGQISPETVVTGYGKMVAEGWDLVKASRIRRADGIYRRVISQLFNRFFRLFFQISFGDLNAKPKIFSREGFAALKPSADDWFIDAEIMIKAEKLQLKIGEFPIQFYALSGRNSLVGLKTIYEFMKNFRKYFFKREIKTHFNKLPSPKGEASISGTPPRPPQKIFPNPPTEYF
jgi:glycosyltransferase involved in cell wall biosynthesis